MANIQCSNHFEDIGRFIKIKKSKVNNKIVYQYVFEHGVLTTIKKL